MKKLFLACALIPCFALAADGFNSEGTRVVVKNGSYSIEYDPRHDMRGASYRLNGNQFRGGGTLPAVVVGSNGAQSAEAIPATYRVVTDKRKVFASLLQKARAAGPAILKGGKALGSLTLRTGWQFLVWQLVSSAISGSKFSWNDERKDFVREADDNTYIVIATKNSHTVVSGSNKTSLEVENLCKYNLNNECEVLDYAKGIESASAVAKAYCQSKTFVEDGKTHHFDYVGWGGHCFSAPEYNRMTYDYGVVIFKYVDYVPMTLDEFIEEGTPEAAESPDEWVKTSEVQPDGEPKILITDGTIAQSRPYTDPADGKAKQSKWTFNSDGSVKEVITDRPDLTPDSPQAPKLDPNAVPDKKTDNPDKKTQPASQPAPIDLCKEHPDILACDTVPDKPETTDTDFDIPKEEVSLKFTPDNVFPTDGVCPVPVQFQAFGSTFGFSLQPACDLASMLRPMIIAFAWLVAAFFCARTIRE
ncbi:IgG-binding virulence factor TspB family protein [uncultured Kingella sp.]|uniref:IgG-binding virulence factor TspB family protein n=1 Tax=uncultured Kingella sp. TaxID=159270 RepID=UPI002598AE81|nr:IgG-binding virulence factor TspB family protein [uncultured Kingella sp.]